jgi:putative glutamine amidotransferase
MVPVIGITCHQDYSTNKLTVNKHYIHAVEKNGALPLLLPDVTAFDMVLNHCDIIDGLILAGGVDVDPRFFGEQPIGTGEITPERDSYEMALAGEFLAKDKPILAICRGLQVLNICAGGDIYQDINARPERVIKHMQQAPKWYPTHRVSVKDDSKLGKILGKSQLQVNSFHHQAPRRVGPGFQATAWSEDGIIEAIESDSHRFIIGIQWHPEQMLSRSEQRKLFQAFIKSCGKGEPG